MALSPYVTPAMWSLWTDRPVSNWRFGGIYSNKPHYHSTVADNLRKWPWSYSVRYALDTRRGPKNKARAIDWTMSDADMRKYTRLLIDAADRNDPRMRGVREFYGTLNSRTVVGRIRDNDSGAYRSSSADSSHLWHIHLAIWAAYCDDLTVLSGVLSILHGQSLAAWRANPTVPGSGNYTGGSDVIGLSTGDEGEEVKGLQAALRYAGHDPGPVDGVYGPKTAAAVLSMRKSQGSSVDDGDNFTGWAYGQLLMTMAKAHGEGVTSTELAEAVADYLRDNPPADGRTPTRVKLEQQYAEVVEVE